MQFSLVQRILGLLLMIFSLTMLPPVLVSLIYTDGLESEFLLSAAIIFFSGLIFWLPAQGVKHSLRVRDGFVVVVLFWVGLGVSGAVPFLLYEPLGISLADAVFESISGLSTTGATVITGLDDLPHSLLYYRQQLQWFGGMGIVVLAVAILPMLGIGGMQLYRAETPGPMKDSKLTPRITETAKALWRIYVGLTIACTLAYWAVGMSFFDALSHAFSTIAIGGFSTHDASMGYFANPYIELVAIIFMFIAGVNFALHFMVFSHRRLIIYWRDAEFRVYVSLMLFAVVITTILLHYHSIYDGLDHAFLKALFQVVSIATTTGFTTAEFYYWPPFLAILLLFASFVGSCAGSTGGGIKVIRFLLLVKQGMREVLRLIHPKAIIPVRVGEKIVSPSVIDAVWGFFALYVASFGIMYLLVALTGVDLITAFSSVAACINNLGPGLGSVGANYTDMTDFAKWVLSFAMLLGRLEIYTLLVLLMPAFWRK
ncbi:MAG: TrkH family potassium uptake protein [gamma proteobacterium symbiont of Bathyaustriella thionipta]|nr:TrkH family potassium uptake protein [gamma proteobacterium symbiont of Bathyaustriella thionipta]